MSLSRCDRCRLSLALIAALSNAGYTSIAPILPLEIDKHRISERCVSLVFLAFSVGSSAAPPLVASRLASVGTFKVMACSMAGMSILFLCLGNVFVMAARLSPFAAADHAATAVLLTTLLQFFMGAFFSAVSTGYYSLVTCMSAEKEATMSTIEAAVGTGYIIGPIVGSWLYEEFGYQHTYLFMSMAMMVLSALTWNVLSRYFTCKAPVAHGNSPPDLEAQNGFTNYNSFENESLAPGTKHYEDKIANTSTQRHSSVQEQNPSTISLLKFPTILLAATTIMWINVSWTCIEPLLAKRLDNFHVGKKEIGIVFSLTNIVYVPTVVLASYLPKKEYIRRHTIISISTMLTPIAVLLVGSSTLPQSILGIGLLGMFPTPVWIMLLPFMQEEAVRLYPEPKTERCVSDLTTGIYNCFMTFGQVLGYAMGLLVESHGFIRMTHIVALLIFFQAMLFHFGTRQHRWRKKRGAVHH